MKPTTSDKRPNIATITIRKGHVAVLDPPIDAAMLLLTEPQRLFVDGGPTGYTIVEESVPLGRLDRLGRVEFDAGQVPRVVALLEAHGWAVNVTDQRRLGRRMNVDRQVRRTLDDREHALVRAVRQHPQGQIEVRNDEDAVAIVIMLCRAFPEARIAIQTPHARDAATLRRRLQRTLHEAVGLLLAGVDHPGRRVLVTTRWGIPTDNAGWYDMLLLTPGAAIARTRKRNKIARSHFGRIYACVVPGQTTDRHILLRLEQLAGPVISALPQVQRPVHVVMMPAPPHSVRSAETALDRKRSAYWHNAARNRLIARVAHALANDDRQALDRLGLTREHSAQTSHDDRKLVVLVECTEHARALQVLLPNWILCALSRGEVIAANCDTADRRIVTLTYAHEHTVCADVVIRATGTDSPLEIPLYATQDDEKIRELLLIDFTDAPDPCAVRDSRRRQQDYQARRYTITEIRHKQKTRRSQ